MQIASNTGAAINVSNAGALSGEPFGLAGLIIDNPASGSVTYTGNGNISGGVNGLFVNTPGFIDINTGTGSITGTAPGSNAIFAFSQFNGNANFKVTTSGAISGVDNGILALGSTGTVTVNVNGGSVTGGRKVFPHLRAATWWSTRTPARSSSGNTAISMSGDGVTFNGNGSVITGGNGLIVGGQPGLRQSHGRQRHRHQYWRPNQRCRFEHRLRLLFIGAGVSVTGNARGLEMTGTDSATATVLGTIGSARISPPLTGAHSTSAMAAPRAR